MTKKVFRLACSVALLGCVMGAPATAQTIDKRTMFKFSGPIALPGITLPAGEYVFRLADPTTGRKVIHVLSADAKKPYGLFFTMPMERSASSGRPEVQFMETAAGAPTAIRTWWYPGERMGYEFVYPKEQARRLAQTASQPVLTTQEQTTRAEQTNTADLTRISSTGQETNVNAGSTPTASTSGGTSQQGTVASPTLAIDDATVPAADPKPVATTGQAPQSARASLPQTASMMPIMTLLGTLALFGGIGLRVWRRNRG